MAGYGSDSGFADWLTLNGYTLPDDAPTAAALRQRGSVYIDGTFGMRFPGYPAEGASQEREWPRTDAEDRHGNAIGASVVPTRVIEAGYAAAYQDAVSPGSLQASGSAGARVKREKVDGAVEVEYQASDEKFSVEELTPVFTQIEGILSPLLSSADYLPAIAIV